MSWMAPIPRTDTSLPWHWVSPAARWHPTEKHPPRAPGYDTVCGQRAMPLDADEDAQTDGPARAYCEPCQRWLADNHPDTLTDLASIPTHPE